MPPTERLLLKTASAANSIWRDVHEDDFRRQMVALEKASGEVPSDPKVHSAQAWQKARRQGDDFKRLLPFHVEQRLADDFAFVAAAKEDPKAVSAATVEERSRGPGLVVRLAANDGVLPVVADTIRAMVKLLVSCAGRVLARSECAIGLFECVIKLCEGRIYGRLGSDHWTRPRHQPGRTIQPLHQGLKRISSSLRGVRSNATRSIQDLQKELDDLCCKYQAVDRCSQSTQERVGAMKEAVRESYVVCTSNGTCSLESTILAHGLDPKRVCKERTIRQVNKIGRYWGLCLDMSEDSRRFKALFQNMNVEYLQPYTGIKSRIYAKTTPKGCVKCHVHAEIQMLVHCDQQANADTLKPRAIGVNKSACYLCNLFFQSRKEYFLTKTHGHLYDQWTLPDLATFSKQQQNEYRRIVAAMTKEMKVAIEKQPKQNRVAPTGSWISLPTPPDTSPLPSDAGTIPSVKSQHGLTPLTPIPMFQEASTTGTNLSSPGTKTPSPTQPQTRSASRLPTPESSLIASLANQTEEIQAQEGLPSAIGSGSNLSSKVHVSLAATNSAASSAHVAPDLTRLQDFPDYRIPPQSPQGSTSTISLHPLNLPLTQLITATKPTHLSSPGLHITFELQGSSAGEVTAINANVNVHESKVPVIDVDEMKADQEIGLVKDGDASKLSFLLHRRTRSDLGDNAMKYELKWGIIKQDSSNVRVDSLES